MARALVVLSTRYLQSTFVQPDSAASEIAQSVDFTRLSQAGNRKVKTRPQADLTVNIRKFEFSHSSIPLVDDPDEVPRLSANFDLSRF